MLERAQTTARKCGTPPLVVQIVCMLPPKARVKRVGEVALFIASILITITPIGRDNNIPYQAPLNRPINALDGHTDIECIKFGRILPKTEQNRPMPNN